MNFTLTLIRMHTQFRNFQFLTKDPVEQIETKQSNHSAKRMSWLRKVDLSSIRGSPNHFLITMQIILR